MRIMSELTLGLSAFALAAALNMALPAFADTVEDAGEVTAVDAGTDVMEISVEEPSGDEATSDEATTDGVELAGDVGFDDRGNCANCRDVMSDPDADAIDGSDVAVDDVTDAADDTPVTMNDDDPRVYQTMNMSGGAEVQKGGIAARVDGGSDRNTGETMGQCLNRVGKSLKMLCK